MWLEADFRVDCETDVFALFWVLAMVVVVLVPLGVPGYYLARLVGAARTYRTQLEGGGCEKGQSSAEQHANDETLRKYETMTRSYRADYIGWEPVDWLRKLFLGGLLMLINRGFVVLKSSWGPVSRSSSSAFMLRRVRTTRLPPTFSKGAWSCSSSSCSWSA